MIAMIVVARSVFNHRSNPYGGKPESFDVVELLDKSLEVATPAGVAVVIRLSVPTLHVV